MPANCLKDRATAPQLPASPGAHSLPFSMLDDASPDSVDFETCPARRVGRPLVDGSDAGRRPEPHRRVDGPNLLHELAGYGSMRSKQRSIGPTGEFGRMNRAGDAAAGGPASALEAWR